MLVVLVRRCLRCCVRVGMEDRSLMLMTFQAGTSSDGSKVAAHGKGKSIFSEGNTTS